MGRPGGFRSQRARRWLLSTGAERQLVLAHAGHTATNATANVALVTVVAFGARDGGHSLALFLGFTLLPFAILAPIIDMATRTWRAPAGVQLRVGLSARAVVLFVIWVLLRSMFLYPLILLVLILQKIHTVTVYSAVPRLSQRRGDLVAANARLTRMAAVGSGVGAALGMVISALASARWSMLAATAMCVVASRCVPVAALADDAQPRVEVGGPTGEQALSARFEAWPSVVCKFVVGALMFALAAAMAGRHGSGRLAVMASVAACGVGGACGTLLGPFAAVRFGLGRALSWCAVSAMAVMLAAGFVGVEWVLPPAVAFVGMTGSLARQHRDVEFQQRLPALAVRPAFARWDALSQAAWVLGAGVVTVFDIGPSSTAIGVGVVGCCAAITSVMIGRSAGVTSVKDGRRAWRVLSTDIDVVVPVVSLEPAVAR